MKERQFDPARINEESPAPGMAAVNTHNPDEMVSNESNESHESNSGERSKGKGENVNRESSIVNKENSSPGNEGSDISKDPNRHNAPNESVVAELNIRSDSPASRDHSKSVEEDVTPRNLEADSDGA